MRRFNVVIPKNDGGVEVHAMKRWLRAHPEHLPAGLDPASDTSHTCRNVLRNNGWRVEEGADEVRLFMPGSDAPEGFVESVLGNTEEDESADEAVFALEHQLRDFIAHNLGAVSVGGRKLHLYKDAEGRGGAEYPTDVGPIDILAVDENGAFVVFELKRAQAPDKALGQLLRYMGWIKATIGKGKEVAGVIVAKPISSNLQYAASVTPNISLFEYQVSFTLLPIKAGVTGE